MKKDEFAYIGCRLLALFYGVKALFDVSSFVTVFVSWNSGLFPSSQVSLGMMYMQLIPSLFEYSSRFSVVVCRRTNCSFSPVRNGHFD